MSTSLGWPRVHLRSTPSTNDHARALASAGAPHGTLVTATEQTAGRGRQGRTWVARPGESLIASLVVRGFDALLPLRTGLAVADVAGPAAHVKWPNDVHLDGRKVAGILVEGRPQEGWAVVGIGLNVAVDLGELPEDVRAVAASLGRSPREVEPTLRELLVALNHRLTEPPAATVAALRERDALLGRPVGWSAGTGLGAGIDDQGRLLVRTAGGAIHALDAGEVHLGAAAGMSAHMSEIHVMPHDDRWAVHDEPGGPPIAEFETREAAELDARNRGGEVIVHAGEAHPERADADSEQASGFDRTDPTHERNRGARGPEEPLTPQAGL